MSLPNIKTTWAPMGIDVEPFDEWLIRQERSFISSELAKMKYLDELYLTRLNHLSKSLIGDSCFFAKEVRLACDQLTIMHNSTYADKLIRGERLSPNLHEEYVKKTSCYG